MNARVALAIVALVASLSGGSATGMFCSPTPGSSHFSEMVQMYRLMSLFHTGAWLKLLSRRTTN